MTNVLTSCLGLGREVDDFDATVFGSSGVRLVLQPRLAVADGAEIGRGQLEVVHDRSHNGATAGWNAEAGPGAG